jgi:predicted nucleic acid-binding protein
MVVFDASVLIDLFHPRTHPDRKAKFDWQIVAIAKVVNARTIYSEDGDISRIGQRLGLAVIKTDDLPLPDSARQTELELPE